MEKPSCGNCGEPIRASSIVCPACGWQLEAPNVRAAKRDEEKNALAERVKKAEVEAEVQGSGTALKRFGDSVNSSVASIGIKLGKFQYFVSEGFNLYPTFYLEVEGESRLPEDNYYDDVRGTVDSSIFPQYFKNIRFAALTLNDSGVSSYGNYTIILKNEMIEHRSSVFECNSIKFFRQHKILATERNLPLGFRATWAERGELAKAKLHARILANTEDKEFPEILVKQSDNVDNQDFIEVHIFGTFNHNAIARTILPEPKEASDQVIVNAIKHQLDKLRVSHVSPASRKAEVA